MSIHRRRGTHGIRYFDNDWLCTYIEKTDKWGRWSPTNWWKLDFHPWIEYSVLLWAPPGSRVTTGYEGSIPNGIPHVYTVGAHKFEETIIHEGFHAEGFDHDSTAHYFKSTTLKACMNPNSRNW